MSKPFLVQWEIEIDADSPEQAIEDATECMPALGSLNDTTATYFTVEDLEAQRTMHFDRTDDGTGWKQVDE